MIKKLRNHPYAPKWEQAPKWKQEEEKKKTTCFGPTGHHEVYRLL
jgi:hypothetical protein